MTKQAVKVGDVVAWDEVPDNTLIRSPYTGDIAARYAGQCHYFASGVALGPTPWSKSGPPALPVVVVAVDLTGSETADELRALTAAYLATTT